MTDKNIIMDSKEIELIGSILTDDSDSVEDPSKTRLAIDKSISAPPTSERMFSFSASNATNYRGENFTSNKEYRSSKPLDPTIFKLSCNTNQKYNPSHLKLQNLYFSAGHDPNVLNPQCNQESSLYQFPQVENCHGSRFINPYTSCQIYHHINPCYTYPSYKVSSSSVPYLDQKSTTKRNSGQTFLEKRTRMFYRINIKYMLSNLIEICKSQHGSRIIQQYLERASIQERENLFQNILPHINDLVSDVFGNYIVQKILEIGTIQQKLEVYRAIKPFLLELSVQIYACRVVQKLLEEFKNNRLIQDEILKEIKKGIINLIEDQNGNHVIQKCFEIIPCERLTSLIEEVISQVDKLFATAYGCRVIQKILEYGTLEQTTPILKRLMAKGVQCCQCQFGNYLMQYILEKGPDSEKQILLEIIKKNFIKFSLNKFASNVAEKSVINGTSEFREAVTEILASHYYDNKCVCERRVIVLMNHPYGNYVLQKLFECSDEKVRGKLHGVILNSEYLQEIKKNVHGKHVMGFIEKLIQI